MSDITFDCPSCGQHIEAPAAAAGRTVTCPNCKGPIKVAGVVPEVTARPVVQQAEIKTNVKQGALIGGFVCFALGGLILFLSRWMFIFYGPLFLVAFILSIVAMAQRRVLGGIILLLMTIIGPPILFIAPAANGEVSVISEAKDRIARARHAVREGQPSAVGGDTNALSEAVEATNTTGRPAPAQAEAEPAPARLGDSILIDGIKITLKGTRLGSVSKRDLLGDAREFKGKYLIVDLTMENTTPGKIIHLQNVWKQSKLTDSFDNVLEPKFDDTFSMDSIVGHVRSEDLRPGETVKDTMIFDVPVAAATTFTITASPGFWKSMGDNRINRLSDTSFKIAFKREDIK